MANSKLTKFEMSLLKGALRSDSRAMKWIVRCGYVFFFIAAISYGYIFLRTYSPKALDRVTLLVLLLIAMQTFGAYQSLIRKLHSSEHTHE